MQFPKIEKHHVSALSIEEYIFRMSSSNNIVKLNVINQLDALSEFHRYFHGAVGATIDSAF